MALLLVAQLIASSSARAITSPGSVPSDIDTIRSRYVLSVLPTNAAQIAHLRELSSEYANSLQPDGEWTDIAYNDNSRTTWGAAEHLDRTLVMAKMARLAQIQQLPDESLNAKVLLALKAWTNRDPRNPNWWWNQIGVPELIGGIATLMFPELSKAELAKVVRIMMRSNWRRVPWTGANLIWGVEIEIVRGCLENNAATVAEGYERMYQEIKVVSPQEEGIQQDNSFHQHGAQLYSGGYGLFYANDVGRLRMSQP